MHTNRAKVDMARRSFEISLEAGVFRDMTSELIDLCVSSEECAFLIIARSQSTSSSYGSGNSTLG